MTTGNALGILGGYIFGLVWGWHFAHVTIATECNRLGGFYVGKTVYECKPKATGENK